MKEIKFRVWDENAKKMLCQITPVVWKNKEGELVFSMSRATNKNVEIMQYTGLHDKNGKEIYEGDIIKLPPIVCHDGNPVIIEFKKGCFTHAGNLREKKCEIIGNIYENEDLLNKE